MNICFTVSRKKMRKRDQVFIFLIICSISFSWRLSLFGFFRFDLSRNELVSQVWKIFQIWRTDFLNKPRVFWIICLFVCFLVCLFQLSSPFLFLVKGKRCSREYTWGPHFGDARVIICVSKRNHSHKSSTDRSKAFLVFVLFVLD